MAGGYRSRVEALTVDNGELITGGWFDSAGGTEVDHIARWDGSTWSPLGSGLYSSPSWGGVGALAVYSADLIVGGHFTFTGGSWANHIARWDGAT